MNDRPVYRHVQVLRGTMWLSFSLVGSLLAMELVFGLRSPNASVEAWSWAIAAQFVLLFCMIALATIQTVEVTEGEVRWWSALGFGWIGGRIPRADLLAPQLTEANAFSGVALLFRGTFWGDVLSGPAIILRRRTRSWTTVLGTDDPQGLIDALRFEGSPKNG